MWARPVSLLLALSNKLFKLPDPDRLSFGEQRKGRSSSCILSEEPALTVLRTSPGDELGEVEDLHDELVRIDPNLFEQELQRLCLPLRGGRESVPERGKSSEDQVSIDWAGRLDPDPPLDLPQILLQVIPCATGSSIQLLAC